MQADTLLPPSPRRGGGEKGIILLARTEPGEPDREAEERPLGEGDRPEEKDEAAERRRQQQRRRHYAGAQDEASEEDIVMFAHARVVVVMATNDDGASSSECGRVIRTKNKKLAALFVLSVFQDFCYICAPPLLRCLLGSERENSPLSLLGMVRRGSFLQLSFWASIASPLRMLCTGPLPPLLPHPVIFIIRPLLATEMVSAAGLRATFPLSAFLFFFFLIALRILKLQS